LASRRNLVIAALAIVGVALAVIVFSGGSDDEAPEPDVPADTPNLTGERLKACIDDTGLSAVGGPDARAGGPTFEVIVTGDGGGPVALIGVYPDAYAAKADLPDVETNLKRATGNNGDSAAEQFGVVNVVWIPNPPTDAAREAVLGCLPEP
jgi:hypothetical protein